MLVIATTSYRFNSRRKFFSRYLSTLKSNNFASCSGTIAAIDIRLKGGSTIIASRPDSILEGLMYKIFIQTNLILTNFYTQAIF